MLTIRGVSLIGPTRRNTKKYIFVITIINIITTPTSSSLFHNQTRYYFIIGLALFASKASIQTRTTSVTTPRRSIAAKLQPLARPLDRKSVV